MLKEKTMKTLMPSISLRLLIFLLKDSAGDTRTKPGFLLLSIPGWFFSGDG